MKVFGMMIGLVVMLLISGCGLIASGMACSTKVLDCENGRYSRQAERGSTR